MFENMVITERGLNSHSDTIHVIDTWNMTDSEACYALVAFKRWSTPKHIFRLMHRAHYEPIAPEKLVHHKDIHAFFKMARFEYEFHTHSNQ